MSDLTFEEKELFSEIFHMKNNHLMDFDFDMLQDLLKDCGVYVCDKTLSNADLNNLLGYRVKEIWRVESNKVVANVNRKLLGYYKKNMNKLERIQTYDRDEIRKCEENIKKAEAICDRLDELPSNETISEKEKKQKPDARISARKIIEEGTYIILSKISKGKKRQQKAVEIYEHSFMQALLVAINEDFNYKKEEFKLNLKSSKDESKHKTWIKNAIDEFYL